MISSKRNPDLIETDRGKEIYNNNFRNLLNFNKIKHYSINTVLGAVFAEIFIRTFGDLLKRPVSERSESNWINILPTITKQYNKRIHSSTKLTPIEASVKKIDGFVYNNLLDKRKTIKPKFRINNHVRTADLKKMFSKSDTTNWSYKLYKVAAIIRDTIPSYHIDNLREKYNESLLKKTELTDKEHKDVMKALNLN